MLNNSWKKYGGISNTEQFHNLNIGTLVADQVLLREKVATETIFNTLVLANGGLRTTTLNATNNIDICNNLIVYNDINAKSKLYFSSNNTNNVYFFKHLNTNFLGLNVLDASATLHIFAGDNTTTNVFRATSLNSSVRSVLAENNSRKGITVNSDNTNSYIKFFNTNTVEGAADTTLISTNAGLFTLSSASHVLSATGGSSLINSTTTMDLSSNTVMSLRAGTGLKILSNNTLDMSSNSTLKINSNTLLNIVSPTTNIYSNLRLSNRNTMSNIYNETLVIYDNSYGNYLYDAYENSSAKTGNALTMVTDTNTSNTFMNIVTPNKLGFMVGGGSYINDNARSMGTIGVTNSTGNYLPTQTIISGNSKAKYYTTLGLNTYAPRSEQYLMNINGATHITNGEINKVLDISYEIINMNFSKYNSKYGIASGTPSSFTFQYNQTLNYTTDGGLNWTAVRFDSNSTSIEGSSKNITISVYDGTYSIIGANNGFAYYTNNGGANWYKFSLPSGQKNIQKVFIQQTTNSSKRIMLAYNTYTADSNIPTTTEVIGYFDITLSSLPNIGYTVSTLNTFTPTITTINCIDGYNDYVYIVGAGIQKYQVSDLSSQYNIKTSNTYNCINVYDNTCAIAVGVNIISYTRNGTDWTDVVVASTTLNSVYIYSTQYAIAVGTNGKIYYTKDSNFETWTIVPDALLNSGGNSVRINGSTIVLRNIHMPDINTFVISNIKQSYVSGSTNGLSKVYNCYFPNLFNRSQNSVLDLSGSMKIAGDINIIDSGNLYVDKNTTLNGNVLANMNIVASGNITATKNIISGSDSLLNGNLFVAYDTSLNSRLVVGSDMRTNKRLFAVGDTSLNSNLFVALDTSLNSKLVVGGDITTNKRLFVNGDTTLNGNLYVDKNTTLTGNVLVNTDITIIGNIITTKNTVSAGDTTINKRLFIVGDTSLNGKLFVDYDTSLNSRLVVGSDITTNKRLFVIGDTSLNSNLFVLKDVSCNGNIYVGKDVTIIGRLNVQNYTNQNIINTTTTNYQLIVSEDISLNGRLCVSSDTSLNANLFVLYDTSLNSKLVVGGDITTNKRLITIGDTLHNGNLFVALDTSLNSRLVVGSDITTNKRLITIGDTLHNGNLFVALDTSLNSRLVVGSDITTNKRLITIGDTLHNGNLFVALDTSLNSRLVVGGDITTNKGLITIGDTLHNGNLFVALDTSLNSRLVVGGDITTNKGLITIGDTLHNGNLFVALDTSLNGNFRLNGSFQSLQDISVNTLTIGLGGASLATSTAVGYQVLKSKTSGNNNSAFGYNALASNTTGELNTAIGSSAMRVGTTANNSVAVGASALLNSIGLCNVAVGNGALQFTTSGDHNVAIGYGSIANGIGGNYNTAIGRSSLSAATGNNNVAIGYEAATTQTTATGTVAIGYQSSKVSTVQTTAVGYYTLLSNTSGIYNTAVGSETLLNNTTGTSNTGLGFQSLRSTTTSNNNTAIGNQSLASNNTGANNTALGFQSGQAGTANTTGSNNTFIGYQAQATANYNNSTAIGSLATITGNNQVVLGTASEKVFIPGDASLNRRLYVSSDTSLNGNLFVAYDTSLNSRLVVGSDITTNKRLFAAGDTSLNGNLFVAYDTSLNSRLVVGSDITTNKRLFAAGDTSLNENLFVAYDTSLNSRLVVGSDITTNKRLFAAGDTSLNGNLFVAYDTSLNGNIVIGRNLLVKGNLAVQNYQNQNIINTTTTNYQLIVSEDLSLNGRLLTTSDASINGLTVGRGKSNIPANTAFGIEALKTVVSGNSNVAVGYQALTALTTGNENVAVGPLCLSTATSGGSNCAIGAYVLPAITSGSNNIGIGFNTLYSVSVGLYNIGIGREALRNTTSSNNTALGFQAGYAGTPNTIGSNNTYIGYQTGANANGYNNSTAIGAAATITSHNQVVIGTSNETIRIPGKVSVGTDFSANFVTIMGNASTLAANAPDSATTANHNLTLYSSKTYSTSPYAMALGVDYTSGAGYINSAGNSIYQPVSLQTRGGNVGIGTVSPSGTLHIYEPTSTVLTPTTASIILEHGDISGCSSILFKSRNNPNSDYGYIYYLDDIFGSTNNGGVGSTERCALCIGVENDEGSLIGGSLNNDVLVLNRGGCYVGVGKTNPATALDVNGTTTSTAFNATSDYRIKTNVVSLQDTSMTIDNLRPVMYTNTLTNKEDIGFIAHEVQEHIPFLVFGEKDGEHHQSINYNGMIGILTREIQDLKKENRNLQQRLALLESKLL